MTRTAVAQRLPTTELSVRSIKMYAMHEALARDRMRERELDQLRVARELAAARRWHRLASRARAAERRHARRAV
jgi:hypothetical protein